MTKNVLVIDLDKIKMEKKELVHKFFTDNPKIKRVFSTLYSSMKHASGWEVHTAIEGSYRHGYREANKIAILNICNDVIPFPDEVFEILDEEYKKARN